MTLAEKGARPEFHLVDLFAGDHKKDDHLALHPFGVIPVLDDEDFRLYESRAILRYLDARLPTPRLTPTSVRDLARMDQWMSVDQSYVAPHTCALAKARAMLRGSPFVLIVVGALASLGCKSGTATAEHAPSDGTAAASAPPSSAAPSVQASAAPSAVASAAAPPEPVPTAMHLFAKTDAGLLAVLPSKRGALITTIDPFNEDPPAVLVEGDRVEPLHGLFSGVGRQEEDYKLANHVGALAGRYPDRFYARVQQVGGRSGSEDYYYVREGAGWKQSLGPDPGTIGFVADEPVAINAISIEPLLLRIDGSKAAFPTPTPPCGAPSTFASSEAAPRRRG